MPYLIVSFLILSWPFINFPLTDGDIEHWVKIATSVRVQNLFLTGPHDQAHGPLLSWTGGLLAHLHPTSFYLYACFSIVMGLLGVFWTYYFSQKFWKNTSLSKLCTFVFSTNIAFIYLSRTPMYDWPAAIFYFGFCGFYTLFIKEHKYSFLILSLFCLSVGSLSRFSISLGLGIGYIAGAQLILNRKKGLKNIIKDIFLITLTVCCINAAWIWGQYTTHGIAFLEEFFYDNIGRYLREPGNSTIHHDYYGFVVYALIALLPYSPWFLASILQKKFLQTLKSDTWVQLLGIAWLPCLVIFSFSGHVKLGRYIAYIVPSLSLFMSYLLFQDIQNTAYTQKVKRLMRVILSLLIALLVYEGFHFNTESLSSVPLVISVVWVIFGGLLWAYYTLVINPKKFLASPEKYLYGFIILYFVFFTVLSYESLHAPFLVETRSKLLSIIQNNSSLE